MKHQVFFGISIRIIFLFTIGFLGTYIPESNRELFGDTYCTIDPETGKLDCDNATIFSFDDGWNWGARHYWFWWMCFLLFVLSGANVIWQSIELFKKHHPEL